LSRLPAENSIFLRFPNFVNKPQKNWPSFTIAGLGLNTKFYNGVANNLPPQKGTYNGMVKTNISITAKYDFDAYFRDQKVIHHNWH
jgi:hypothetical protein